MQSVRGEIDKAIEKISSLYLRSKKIEKPYTYSSLSN
jgi:hypothetical protein